MKISTISYFVFKMRRLFSRVLDINKNKTFYGNTILSIDKGSDVICRLLQEKKRV